ncbi:MAG: hypothetical protein AMK74_00095 [Nitrospira bacterium SM23_35]|nr:MAG: hypothetical protein AMK74_00095 [Nitrospira bacterium SM23_35]
MNAWRAQQVLLFLGVSFFSCLLATKSQADSEIRLWKGQTVNVPVYPHIYIGDKEIPLDLSTNLSVRNTDSENSITVVSVDYYDSDGKLVRKYVEKPALLNPMASAYFLAKTSDTRGGWGANFIVEWRAEKEATEPLIESVITGARGTHSYSFVTRGKPIKGTSK